LDCLVVGKVQILTREERQENAFSCGFLVLNI
jgi:hypothetical protein